MHNFDELLKNTIANVNKGFEEAQNDLYKIIGELNNSLANLGPFTLEISTISSSVSGEIYRLDLNLDSGRVDGQLVPIATFSVPSSGYPIAMGQYFKNMDEFRTTRQYYEADAIAEYFSALSSDANSPLIQAIGYALRKKRN